MIMNKKGLSDVVTTVLIILLAIAAIVIVWNFVSPTLENAGSQIESQTACLDASVVAVSCTKPVSPATTGTITFRNDGGQAVDVKGILVYTDSSTTVGSSVGTATPYGSSTVGVTSSATATNLLVSARVAVTKIGTTVVSCDPTPVVPC